jgi:hypothetical protein
VVSTFETICSRIIYFGVRGVRHVQLLQQADGMTRRADEQALVIKLNDRKKPFVA